MYLLHDIAYIGVYIIWQLILSIVFLYYGMRARAAMTPLLAAAAAAARPRNDGPSSPHNMSEAPQSDGHGGEHLYAPLPPPSPQSPLSPGSGTGSGDHHKTATAGSLPITSIPPAAAVAPNHAAFTDATKATSIPTGTTASNKYRLKVGMSSAGAGRPHQLATSGASSHYTSGAAAAAADATYGSPVAGHHGDHTSNGNSHHAHQLPTSRGGHHMPPPSHHQSRSIRVGQRQHEVARRTTILAIGGSSISLLQCLLWTLLALGWNTTSANSQLQIILISEMLTYIWGTLLISMFWLPNAPHATIHGLHNTPPNDIAAAAAAAAAAAVGASGMHTNNNGMGVSGVGPASGLVAPPASVALPYDYYGNNKNGNTFVQVRSPVAGGHSSASPTGNPHNRHGNNGAFTNPTRVISPTNMPSHPAHNNNHSGYGGHDDGTNTNTTSGYGGNGQRMSSPSPIHGHIGVPYGYADQPQSTVTNSIFGPPFGFGGVGTAAAAAAAGDHHQSIPMATIVAISSYPLASLPPPRAPSPSLQMQSMTNATNAVQSMIALSSPQSLPLTMNMNNNDNIGNTMTPTGRAAVAWH
jgi:hypothetical protein